VSRPVQDLAGGAFLPSATGLVASIFPIGAIIGPVIGGIIVTVAGWRTSSRHVRCRRARTYLTDPGTPAADALDLLRSWVATTSTPAISSGSSTPSSRPKNTSAAD